MLFHPQKRIRRGYMNQLLVYGMNLSEAYGLIQRMYQRENPLMASQMSLAIL